jgi:hypothetical protein
MSRVSNLRSHFLDFQITGKSEEREIKAVLAILIDMAERLEEMERDVK